MVKGDGKGWGKGEDLGWEKFGRVKCGENGRC